MTKIDIFSGFLGAGKTTLIKKLLGEVYKGEKIVLIENEFGEISIDGGFLKESGVREPEAQHIRLAEALIFSDNPSARGNFPGGITISRNYDTLEVLTPSEEAGLQILCSPAAEIISSRQDIKHIALLRIITVLLLLVRKETYRRRVSRGHVLLLRKYGHTPEQ
jgi:hypothetical protein